ncbi:hypothetical protein GJ496_008156 [Pomphorhynchus laevis]|nr:hypothetical protein GJ496_008156 [Pomphorhynchus laevis]
MNGKGQSLGSLRMNVILLSIFLTMDTILGNQIDDGFQVDDNSCMDYYMNFTQKCECFMDNRYLYELICSDFVAPSMNFNYSEIRFLNVSNPQILLNGFRNIIVERLIMSNCNLIDFNDQAQFTYTTGLEYLDISNNQVKELDFSDISFWKCMINLNLAHNPLREDVNVVNKILEYSPKLKHLNMSYCNITTIPRYLVKHQHLEILLLAGNRLRVYSVDNILRHLHNLAVLDLSYNNLEQFPKGVTNWQIKHDKMKLLILKGNHLRQMPHINFGKLIRLDVSSNLIETFRADILFQCDQLQFVNLSNNKLFSLDNFTSRIKAPKQETDKHNEYEEHRHIYLDLQYNNITQVEQCAFPSNYTNTFTKWNIEVTIDSPSLQCSCGVASLVYRHTTNKELSCYSVEYQRSILSKDRYFVHYVCPNIDELTCSVNYLTTSSSRSTLSLNYMTTAYWIYGLISLFIILL